MWNPSTEKDVKLIESVQRRASKIPFALRGMKYEERLKVMGLTTLSERRKRGDLIQMFKVMRCSEPINWINTSEVKCSLTKDGPCGATRGNSLRLSRESFPSKRRNDFASAVSIGHGFFLNRVIPDWNKLPEDVIQSKTVVGFKTALDRIGCYSSTSS